MKKLDFKKIFGKLKAHPRIEYRTISAKAHHDWKVMVIFFSLLWFFIFIGSTYFFFEINRGDFFSSGPKTQNFQTSVNKKILNNTVEYFDARSSKLQELKSQRPTSTDPAI